MKTEKELEEVNKTLLSERGWKEDEKIDLVNNKKEALKVNAWGLLIMLVMALFLPFFNIEGFYGESFFMRTILLFVLIILYIPLHEIVHGIVMKCFTKEKLRFGWKLVYAYCGSFEGAFRYYPYALIALAPLLFFSLVFINLIGLVPSLSFAWYVMEIINVSGSVGDIYVSIRLWKRRKENIYIVDTGTDMTVWKK